LFTKNFVGTTSSYVYLFAVVQLFADTRVLGMLVVDHWVSWDCQKWHKQPSEEAAVYRSSPETQCSWCSCFWWGIVLLIRKRLLFTETCWKLVLLIAISPVESYWFSIVPVF